MAVHYHDLRSSSVDAKNERTSATLTNEQFVRELTAAQRSLYGYIYSLVPSAEAANDVLQETNLALWRKCDEVSEIRSFRAWAYTIARYQVMTWVRQRGREKLRFSDSLVDVLAAESAERMEQADDRQRALSACLKELPAHGRALIRQRYSQGASVVEIAERSQRTSAAVSQVLYRLRNTLQECIERRLSREEWT